ncbi:DegV family protein [Bacillus sp. RG28]|uniref:DegV family protein n=1 Tax=Gottfriedia endophytica TaxID=2820819 RepID=A0A940NTP6_9BACI|nr:DegV family protein [Gottfriedia endophytica]MBP0727343.1 DegV family protein [Gottfriedia endophytica]
MSKIKIVTDSTVDFSNDQINELGITVIPLSIQIDGNTYLDGVELSSKEFLSKMKQSEELPKTSQPAVGTFVDLYEELTKDGSQVISIHMTSGMSGTYSTANTAANLVEGDVNVVDSGFITLAMGFQVSEAVKMAKNGATVKQILERLEEIKNNTNLYVMVDTLDNLVKGGRIGKGKALIGSLLNIKPLASLAGGVYTPIGKARSYSQVVKMFTKYFEQDTAGKTVKGIGIAHAEAIPLATSLKEAIQKLTDFIIPDITYTTPVISTHTGEGAIGFVFYAE